MGVAWRVEGKKPDQMWGRAVLLHSDLAGFLLKLDFTRKCTDEPRRRFRNLTKFW